ncbi:lytic transglycosylase domain-containing protein [Photobacterium damselae]|uniref:lytic transglycosylase domain-containing protein n=1 Tax=Photobacterium damselae TaxID=38293 RepID=UPI001F21568C|nr:lytic transglycosylase domain-containing protein [Photobacterium damselae]UKA04551.1 lytic transglycosylase domain-containing protein [Photobacterium damselae subsp. damselae]
MYAKSHKTKILHNASNLYDSYRSYRREFKWVFDKYQVPSEIMALSAIESSFNPDARSSVGAVGLWQFMPSTARSLGLVVNGAVDQRKDATKSTIAAVKYIKWLAEDCFGGDYETAVISYNYGIGNTKQAIAKAKSANAWVLISGGFVPKESADHLMKFLSYVEVFDYMDQKLKN